MIQFSGARRGAPRGRPAQAALTRPLTQPPGHPGSPRRRFAGARGGQAGSQTPLPGVVRRPPSCPAAARPQPHSPARREWADRSGQRGHSSLAYAGTPPGPRGLRVLRCRRPRSAGAGGAHPGPRPRRGGGPGAAGPGGHFERGGAAARWLRGHEVGRGAAHRSGTRVERALPPISAAALRAKALRALMTAQAGPANGLRALRRGGCDPGRCVRSHRSRGERRERPVACSPGRALWSGAEWWRRVGVRDRACFAPFHSFRGMSGARLTPAFPTPPTPRGASGEQAQAALPRTWCGPELADGLGVCSDRGGGLPRGSVRVPPPPGGDAGAQEQHVRARVPPGLGPWSEQWLCNSPLSTE